MKRLGNDGLKQRRKTFIAMLAAALLFFNLMPMNVLASNYYDYYDHCFLNGQVLRQGDQIFFSSGAGIVLVDGVNSDNVQDGYCYEIGADDNSTRPVNGVVNFYRASTFDVYNVALTTVYQIAFMTGFADVFVNTQYVASNGQVTEPADPVKEGYIFDKWQYSSVDNGLTSWHDWDFANDTIQGNLDLYAKWTPIVYTVVFNSNGGTGTMNNQARVYDDGTALPANAFTRTGYEFCGWNTMQDGTGTAYAAGSIANLTNIDGANVTLYAQWTELNWSEAIPQQTVNEGYQDISQELISNGYDTEEKIQDALYRAVVNDNPDLNGGNVVVGTKLYDVIFQVSFDGGVTYVPVTPQNFPPEGLVVNMPYPEGTNKDSFNFSVSHMFAYNVNGNTAGQIEKPAVTKTDTGIQFRVMGLSPILVAWTSIPAPEPEPEPEPQPVLEVRAPKTGDGANIATYMIMTSLIAGIALTAYGAAQKRRKR